jgi:hypothetical protein
MPVWTNSTGEEEVGEGRGREGERVLVFQLSMLDLTARTAYQQPQKPLPSLSYLRPSPLHSPHPHQTSHLPAPQSPSDRQQSPRNSSEQGPPGRRRPRAGPARTNGGRCSRKVPAGKGEGLVGRLQWQGGCRGGVGRLSLVSDYGLARCRLVFAEVSLLRPLFSAFRLAILDSALLLLFSPRSSLSNTTTWAAVPVLPTSTTRRRSASELASLFLFPSPSSLWISRPVHFTYAS